MKREYSIYYYSKKNYIQNLIRGMGIGAGIGVLFYSNFAGVLFLLPYGVIYANKKKKEEIKERKWQFNLEFLDGLYSLSTALSAGYAVENAFMESLKDLRMIYETDSYILKEFQYMTGKIKNNVPIEEVLKDFSDYSNIEDIHNFCQVFVTAKQTGGDLVKIIRNAYKIINDKAVVKREIVTMITAKKIEGKVMNIIPMAIIAYLRICSPEFLVPLYHNAFGFIFMTGILLVYYVAIRISENIMNIEV